MISSLTKKAFSTQTMRAVLQRPGGDINTLYLGETHIPVNINNKGSKYRRNTT